MKDNRNDTLSNSSATPIRSDVFIFADESVKAADLIRWSRMLELRELGSMAENIFIAGFYCMGDLMDTSAREKGSTVQGAS